MWEAGDIIDGIENYFATAAVASSLLTKQIVGINPPAVYFITFNDKFWYNQHSIVPFW